MSKRLFDVFVSAMALLVLAPILGLIALAVLSTSEGPAFFRQERVGLRGKPFRIVKFRSMATSQKPDAPQVTAKDDPRITSVGRVLRQTKLDELPQLFNVLVGDMSFVGPRPEVPKYVRFYSDADRQLVLSVRPGITDLASIEFRDEEVILAAHADREKAYVEDILPRKLAYYREYAQNPSFRRDLGIIFKTLLAVAGR